MGRKRAIMAVLAAQPAKHEQPEQQAELELPHKFLFTLTEAAELLSISRTTLYAEMKRGTIESVHVGGRRLVPYAVLAAFVNRLMREQGLRQYTETVD